MHARYDGVVGRTFPKPSRSQSVVVTNLGVVGGYDLTVYAESRDNGNTVFADVFVNGRSLTSGVPLEAIPERATNAVVASTEHARIGCLTQGQQLVWITPIVIGFNALRNFHGSNAFAAVALVFAGSCLAAGVAYLLMSRALRRPMLTRNSAIAITVLAYCLAFAGSMAALVLAIAITGAK